MIDILAASLPEHLSILGFLPADFSPSPSPLIYSVLFLSVRATVLYTVQLH